MSEQKQLTLPTVHLNGTSAKGLLEPLCEAYTAVNEAMAKLAQTAPNARDYYVQADPRAFYKAQDEHYDRMARLRSVADELGQIAESLPI